MPFTSQSQAATCFNKQISAKSKGKKWTWDCLEFLKATSDPACLPYRKGATPKLNVEN